MLLISVAIVTIIVVALVFDYINGFHDAANSIATVVATKVLRPSQAVAWAAFWNFVAAFFFTAHVAKTVGKGVVDPSHVTIWVIFSGLVGAIVWDLITWYFGLPTSSSHALIGGFAGAALMKARTLDVLVFSGINKVLLFIILSPLIGMLLGFISMVVVYWLFRKMAPGRIDKWFRRLQLLSAAAYSLGHGLNDAQKTMGIIWILLIASPPAFFLHLPADSGLPVWVKLSCQAAIALGTLMGGWRIVKTMGLRLTKLKPVGGFCAETAGAATIIGASLFGIPVSTTHTITGAIVGVGATNRLSAVRWGVAGRIVWAWVLTIPASGAIAAGTYFLISPLVK